MARNQVPNRHLNGFTDAIGPFAAYRHPLSPALFSPLSPLAVHQ